MLEAEQTVFLVSDDPAGATSLCRLLESAGYRVRSYPSAELFLDDYDGSASGCLVLDIDDLDQDTLGLLSRLPERGWCLPAIIASELVDVDLAVRAMKEGAFDFLHKPYDDAVILERIPLAFAKCKERRHNQELLAIALAGYRLLTPREREVAERVVAGMSNKLIASALGLSHKTIEVHRANVMTKMAAASLSELVRVWIRLQEAGIVAS